MNLQQIPGLEMVQPDGSGTEIADGYTSDLLSDVVAHAKAGAVLITIQAHKNTIAVATLVGLPAIIICNNRPIPSDMLDAARKERILLFRTANNQFLTSHHVYQLLNAS